MTVTIIKRGGGRPPGWTREQGVAAHRLRATGLSMAKIAKQLCLTPRRVRWILERHPEFGQEDSPGEGQGVDGNNHQQ